ncbi:MAG TPA: tRNA uridine-5-carboxymethylaminomethyl(34) synthesis GTPase MnmE [Geminicoccaceae bacterium]|nr:tRNA uridine-5-carboxymethylaminomethyl(34) synthesis GTPase MnmE [Geminicoccaceae bacterium]
MTAGSAVVAGAGSEATIYAPATAVGRSALAVLRITGPRAAEAARALTGRAPPEPRRAALRRLRDPATGETVDEALLLWFPGPRSETGEDLLEVQHHGGQAVLAWLLEALGRLDGFRPAGPGEFTKRAFLNGKLDLTAAEGLADLVDAATRAQACQAFRQLAGELGRLYAGWRERLLTALALVEAEIDFAADGEEVPDATLARVLPDLARIEAEMAAHLADGARGERLRAGVTVAVVGAPNVGKSSLVNLLARRDVAIVTPIPGTTRDVIEVHLDLGGVPVVLLDTAGLRETGDPVEAEGVARALSRAEQADLRLHVVDATDPAPSPPPDAMTLTVVNKIDLVPYGVAGGAGGIGISCWTGTGLAELLRELTARAGALAGLGEAPLLTRARHREAVAEARASLARLQAGPDGGGGELALLAEDLRLAARAVGRLTGAVGVEEVLDRVFATFCIGK